MRIRILGCSGGVGDGRRTTAMLVDEHVLIDAGTGVGDLPLEALRRIDRVFLTHSHLDHIAALPLFIDSVQGRDGRASVHVHGREETLAALREHVFNNVIWPDFSQIEGLQGPLLELRAITPGAVVRAHGLEIGAVDVSHGLPALGYWVARGERCFAFSGDTHTNRSLWPALNARPALDLLVVDVSFPDAQRALAERAGHYCPHTLAEDLGQLRHRPAIRITAAKPGEEAVILDEVRRALPGRDVAALHDGQTLALEPLQGVPAAQARSGGARGGA